MIYALNLFNITSSRGGRLFPRRRGGVIMAGGNATPAVSDQGPGKGKKR